MDYIKHMVSSEPDPQKSGDTQSWFLFYKWKTGGETFFPIALGELDGIKEGDRLWFCMDYALIGYVNVLRITEDVINNRLEVWYDGSKCHSFDPDFGFGKNTAAHKTGPVPEEIATTWLGVCSDS